MDFFVRPRGQTSETGNRPRVYLSSTGWDDWFQYSTLHEVVYIDKRGDRYELGTTKIGQFGLRPAASRPDLEPGYRKPNLPERFTALDESFFSLGQDPEFYEALTNRGAVFRDQVLRALRDVAYLPDVLEQAVHEDVMGTSLLRSVPLRTVRDQFARLAQGGARLTPYMYTYRRSQGDAEPVEMPFSVEPDSQPPTNVHVVIGRNGVGKSTLLNNIAEQIVDASDGQTNRVPSAEWEQFSNIVSVSFSAFDDFAPSSASRNPAEGLPHEYVGLKRVSVRSEDETPIVTTKNPDALSKEMGEALAVCLLGARRTRLARAIRLLEGDPIFAGLGIGDLMEDGEGTEISESLSRIFRRLSSGHRIVLLTVTKLVETVEEKSLVLMDEPEAHLHPPLLSAFVRALSDLLTNRNGMAIVATHSPVVLQEVPKSCVWMLHRNRDVVSVERPRLETFGENAGVLTDEVFGLEVTATGFHKMLDDVAATTDSYEEALEKFDGQLGAEGRAILRAMTSTQRRR